MTNRGGRYSCQRRGVSPCSRSTKTAWPMLLASAALKGWWPRQLPRSVPALELALESGQRAPHADFDGDQRLDHGHRLLVSQL